MPLITMQIVRASTYKRMPWRNGGGETAEVLVSPAGADFASMDWRISMATVTADGPFSSFPGIDRTLSVLSGTLRLEIAGTAVDLMEMSPPHSFAGEAVVSGVVLRGPVADLNVMTRRETHRHDVRRTSVAGEKAVTVGAGTLVLFCHTGAVTLPGGETLSAADAAVGETPGAVVSLRSAVPSIVYVITIAKRTAC